MCISGCVHWQLLKISTTWIWYAQRSLQHLQLCFASRLCQLSGLVNTCKPWIHLRTLQIQTNSHHGFDFVMLLASFAPLSVCFHLERIRLSFWKEERFGWQRTPVMVDNGFRSLHARIKGTIELAWDPRSNTCGGIWTWNAFHIEFRRPFGWRSLQSIHKNRDAKT